MKIKKSVLRNIVRESIAWCIVESSKSSNTTIDKVKSNIQNRILGRFNGDITDVDDENFKEDVLAMGINPNYNLKDYNKMKGGYMNSNFETVLRDEIVAKGKELSKYVVRHKDTGEVIGFNYRLLKQDCDAGKTKFSYIELMRAKEFLDIKGYGIDALYLDPDSKSDFALDFEHSKNLGKISNYEKHNGKIYDTRTAWGNMIENFLNKYMDMTYGLSVKLPVNVFTNGNAKLPNDTLIINFTSAMQCPAWNECLVKDACYARQGEKGKTNVRNANTYRGLMWRSSYNDDTLTKMIFQLIRLYCVNYTKVVEILKNSKSDFFKKFSKQIGSRSMATFEDELSKVPFSELDQEIITIMQQHLKAKYIRLNEDGDFIGNWLVEKIDNFAGELSVLGITCSAYTCRILGNTKKVSNIIINSSKTQLKGEGITRYFMALSEKLFDCFEDTYKNKITDEHIIPAPQKLYNAQYSGRNNNFQFKDKLEIISENGKYFYKCPCESGKNVNCYNCRLCYGKENFIPEGSSLYVFVKAHGANKDLLADRLEEVVTKCGVTREFLNRYYKNEDSIVSKQLTESEMRSIVKNSLIGGINAVSNNCINSVKSHLNELSYNGE